MRKNLIPAKRRIAMSTLATLTILLLSSHYSRAQNISGRVIDQNNSPLEYVTTVLKRNDSIVSATVTDSLGYFIFRGIQPSSTYHISFNRIGYKPLDTLIQSANQQFVLQNANGTLKTVTVSAKKPLIERQVDRLIFNVEGNVNTAGLDAMELLSKAPLVRVRNDVPSIVGRDNVQVLINGRPSNMSPEALRVYLKSLQSDQITRIEVITNPPAEYDPSGNGGLINLVIKKNKKLGLWTTVNSGLTIAKYAGGRAGVNFNYNNNKLNLFGGLNLGKGANWSIYKDDIFYSQYTWKQEYINKELSKYLMGNLGFEIPLSKKTTLNA